MNIPYVAIIDSLYTDFLETRSKCWKVKGFEDCLNYCTTAEISFEYIISSLSARDDEKHTVIIHKKRTEGEIKEEDVIAALTKLLRQAHYMYEMK